MLDVAIVEDDDIYAETLSEYLDKYSREKGEKFGVTRYSEAVSFLENYRPHFAIVLMDIELPMMNGMEAARKMREKDGNACLIFVTNMAQFACDGYGVDALDFIVKPVSYADFAMKLDRAVKRARKNMGEELYISVAGGGYRVHAADHRICGSGGSSRDVSHAGRQSHRKQRHVGRGGGQTGVIRLFEVQ